MASVLTAYEEFAQEHKIPEGVGRRVKLALDDLLNNVASYAYPGSDSGDVDVSMELWPNRLVISIADGGVPFNPLDAPPPASLPGVSV